MGKQSVVVQDAMLPPLLLLQRWWWWRWPCLACGHTTNCERDEKGGINIRRREEKGGRWVQWLEKRRRKRARERDTVAGMERERGVLWLESEEAMARERKRKKEIQRLERRKTE